MKFFLVYWLIAYITISSGSIKCLQNSDVFYHFSCLGCPSFRSQIQQIQILSGLSGYNLTHFHDQAVNKNNSDGHSPGANDNDINLCLLCYDCMDLPRRSKTSKVKQRSAKEEKKKTRKQHHGCHCLLVFVKRLFTLNDCYPTKSKSIHL